MRQKVYRRAKIGKGSAEAFLLPKKSYPRGSFVRGAGNDGRIAAGSCGPGVLIHFRVLRCLAD